MVVTLIRMRSLRQRPAVSSLKGCEVIVEGRVLFDDNEVLDREHNAAVSGQRRDMRKGLCADGRVELGNIE
jgi:hypothetical protein